jgi:hypothetical protein
MKQLPITKYLRMRGPQGGLFCERGEEAADHIEALEKCIKNLIALKNVPKSLEAEQAWENAKQLVNHKSPFDTHAEDFALGQIAFMNNEDYSLCPFKDNIKRQESWIEGWQSEKLKKLFGLKP